MEFRFQTRSEAKDSPFFFSDEEIEAGGTAYGWQIVVLDELYPEPEQPAATLKDEANAIDWDAYCAVLARRFARRDHPHLGYEDFFQEARLKVCELLAEGHFPLASPQYRVSETYSEVTEEEEGKLSPEERQQHRLLKDNVRFRSSLRRALLDYGAKNR